MDTDCPTSEELAAFAEGRLAGEQRGAVLRHVSDCTDCTEVLGGTLRFRREEAGGQLVAPAVFGRRRWRAALLAAAVALGAIGTVLLLRLAIGEPEIRRPRSAALPSPQELTGLLGSPSELQALAAAAWEDESQALGFGSGLSLEKRAFRLGVTVTDLQVGVAAGDTAAATVALVRLRKLLGPLADTGAARGYQEAAGKLAAGVDPQSLVSDLSKLAPDLAAASDSFQFELGRFAETGRLAAGGSRSAFFSDPACSSFVAAAVARPLEEPVARELAAIRASLAAAPNLDFDSLVRSFEQLILLH